MPLDHLVICAQTLAQGVDWFAARSGVTLPEGGRHPLMGTHNHLTALSPTAFLEIIAVDPLTPGRPARARWFELDEPAVQAALAHSPRLATWVVATDDLQTALQRLTALGIDAGQPVTQTRGDLRWQIALRADGSLAFDGIFPVLIQWPAGINPVVHMQDQGIRLDALRLCHPEHVRLQSGLNVLDIEAPVSLSGGDPALRANLCIADHHFVI